MPSASAAADEPAEAPEEDTADLALSDDADEGEEIGGPMQLTDEEPPQRQAPAGAALEPHFVLVRRMAAPAEAAPDFTAVVSAPPASAASQAPSEPAAPPSAETDSARPATRTHSRPEVRSQPQGLLLTLRRLLHIEAAPSAEEALEATAAKQPPSAPGAAPARPPEDLPEADVAPADPSAAETPQAEPVLPSLPPTAQELADTRRLDLQDEGRAPVLPRQDAPAPLTLLRRLLPQRFRGEPLPALDEGSPASAEPALEPTEVHSLASPTSVARSEAASAESTSPTEFFEAPAPGALAAPQAFEAGLAPLVLRSEGREAPPGRRRLEPESGAPSPAGARAPTGAAEPSLVYRSASQRPAGGQATPLPPEAHGQAEVAALPDGGGWPAGAWAHPEPAIVSRQARDAVGEPGAAAPATPAAAAPAAETPLSGAALESLALQVYARLRRKLITDRERAGLGAQWL